MTNSGFRFAGSKKEFVEFSAAVTAVIDPAARLPCVPFRAQGGRVAVGEFAQMLGVDFVPVFRTLAETHGDATFVVLAIEPPASYFEGAGILPAFIVETRRAEDAYWDGLRFSPVQDPTDELGESSDVIAVVGASQRWAVWGQRSWNLALVWTASNARWDEFGVPLVGPRRAVQDFAGYGTWGTRLDATAVEKFIGSAEDLT